MMWLRSSLGKGRRKLEAVGILPTMKNFVLGSLCLLVALGFVAGTLMVLEAIS